jgi:hypothetical protein
VIDDRFATNARLEHESEVAAGDVVHAQRVGARRKGLRRGVVLAEDDIVLTRDDGGTAILGREAVERHRAVEDAGCVAEALRVLDLGDVLHATGLVEAGVRERRLVHRRQFGEVVDDARTGLGERSAGNNGGGDEGERDLAHGFLLRSARESGTRQQHPVCRLHIARWQAAVAALR